MVSASVSNNIDLSLINKALNATAEVAKKSNTAYGEVTVKVLRETDGGYAVELKLGNEASQKILLTSTWRVKRGASVLYEPVFAHLSSECYERHPNFCQRGSARYQSPITNLANLNTSFLGSLNCSNFTVTIAALPLPETPDTSPTPKLG